MMIDRTTYNRLIKNFPKWMENNWESLDRSWSLAGCRINGGQPDTLDELHDLLRIVRNFV